MEFLDKYTLDEKLFDKLKIEMIKRFSNKSDNTVNEITRLSLKKKEFKEKQNLLIQKNLNGILNDTLLKEQLNTIEEEIWSIDKALIKTKENKVDIESIFEYVSEFLHSPSKTWQKGSLETKIKLQWFTFPSGVIFSEDKFRTTKLSSIFKLKQFFLSDMSPTVRQSKLYYKHDEFANFPTLQSEANTVWNEIKDELLLLKEIMSIEIEPTPYL